MSRLVEGRTKNQKAYIKSIIKEELIVCEGMAGTGKSYCAIGTALELIQRENSPYKKLWLSRPMISCADTEFATLPGQVNEKVEPYLRPMFHIIEDLIGTKAATKLVEGKVIEFIPIALARGFTFSNSICYFDEMQNCSLKQLKMLVTRMGKDNCKMIFAGDLGQPDLGDNYYSGLHCMCDHLKNKPDIAAYIKMLPEDNQRNAKVVTVLKALGL